MTGRRFRFGVQMSGADSAEAWRGKARKAEELGYTTLVIPDHFGGQMAFGPALTAAAGATTTLRLGTFVLDNDFRHPALVATEAATVDLLSEGRFELGLGAGWMPADYTRAGLTFDPPNVRVQRLEETVSVIKALFHGGPLTLAGEHYRVSGLEGYPRPVQRPHPPILLGGAGRRMLSLAAREADIVSILPRTLPTGERLDATDATVEVTQRKIDIVRESAGQRLSQIEINVLVQVFQVTADRERAAAGLSDRFKTNIEGVLQSPFVLIGTVDQMIDDLKTRRERFGISYLVVFEEWMEACAGVVQRLAGR